ncbi:MAG: rhodanese-like domain-containing protein [Paracoccaceae bacterium]
MSDVLVQEISEASPHAVWEALKSNPTAVLVDVRTIAEWDYIGLPVLESLGKEVLKVEWMEFPEMTRNEHFAAELLAQFKGNDPSAIYFICRSGVRSLYAARCLTAALEGTGRSIECINVTGGFEGDHDDNKHRGKINGWKVCGLPWCQP